MPPPVRKEVTIEALPLFSAALPSARYSSVNATYPLPGSGDTVAVMVTESPALIGASGVRAVVVTVCAVQIDTKIGASADVFKNTEKSRHVLVECSIE